MRLQLMVKPRGSGFLRSHAQEIGACVTGETVKLFTIVVITVIVIPVPVLTVAGLE